MFTVRVLGLHRILNVAYTMRAGPQPVDAPPAQIPACRSHTQRNASFKVRGLPWSEATSFKQCVCHLSPFYSTAGLKYPPHSTLVNSARRNSSHSKCLLALIQMGTAHPTRCPEQFTPVGLQQGGANVTQGLHRVSSSGYVWQNAQGALTFHAYTQTLSVDTFQQALADEQGRIQSPN